MQNNIDFYLLLDPGVSTLKVLLYRAGNVLAHFITSSCEEISEENYEREKESDYEWGCGVVKFPANNGIKYYRIGVNPISKISPALYKWDVTAIKTICMLGWLGKSSKGQLNGSLTILLPIDEDIDRGPLSRAIKYAIANGAICNGTSLNNINLVQIRIPFEGSGFCVGDRTSGGIIAGHSDVSFSAGDNGAVKKHIGFTLSGAGAILPLNLAGLNHDRMGELNSAIEFQKALKSCNFKKFQKGTMRKDDWLELVSSGKWDKFLTRGLILEDIYDAATTGIMDYINHAGKDFHRIGLLCEQYRIDPLPIGGGSGQMIGLLFGPILKEFVRIQGTKETEDRVASIFPALDRIACTKLVDLFQVASQIDEFQYFFENGPTPPTMKEAKNVEG